MKGGILVLSLFMITGCGNSSDTTKTKSKVFIGGTQGLSIKFEAFGVTENNIYTHAGMYHQRKEFNLVCAADTNVERLKQFGR